MNTRFSKAFTIVELLIVIVVIGILAGITIIGYGAVVGNANDTSVKSDLEKLSDSIKLKGLDDQIIPAGGMTSTGFGSATTFTGITIKPGPNAYDKTVTNLYYCEGKINDVSEYAVAARSKSTKAFAFISNQGMSAFSANVWTAASNGPAVCAALGFTGTFSWSYGLNGATGVWSAWATP